MRDGGFPEGSCVLGAKIAMDHENMNMRDPVLYRIRRSLTFAPVASGLFTRPTIGHMASLML